MHFSYLLTTLAATLASANPFSALPHSHFSYAANSSAPLQKIKHFDCGTNASHASTHFLNTVHNLHTSSPSRLITRAVNSIYIDLYLHVVSTHANAGVVTKAMLAAQFTALNTAYNPYGIHFVLRNTSNTTNDVWAIGATSADDVAMKTTLRQGSYASLNLYFQTDLAGGVLGRCTLPTSVGAGSLPATYVADGCNIAAGTMPGGSIGGYDAGKTAVHESGHWLGLLHTFEGYSCTGSGDYVSDTPAEMTSTDGCPTNPWKNTCGTVRKGVDPIHNYMDYSTDECYVRFTPGQQQRMLTLWPVYRAGK